jgi:hypothetical protein
MKDIMIRSNSPIPRSGIGGFGLAQSVGTTERSEGNPSGFTKENEAFKSLDLKAFAFPQFSIDITKLL